MYRTTYGPKVREAFFSLQTDSRKPTMTTPAIEASTREATTAEPLLCIDSLSITFGDQQVLRNISLELTSGESLVILGESGCGKTVLLKTMIGLIQPTTGDVRFEDTSLASMTDVNLPISGHAMDLSFKVPLFSTVLLLQRILHFLSLIHI